ncbi:hypothetical protein ANTQUA_LOCUS10652, partial [Anthophora quadrimaculata]
MVPAAAVIPAPIAYIKVVAVKKLVVESVCHSVSSPLAVFNWHYVVRPTGGFCSSRGGPTRPRFYFVGFRSPEVMINRDRWGHSYCDVRGEILGSSQDGQKRKHLPKMFSLIKNESRSVEVPPMTRRAASGKPKLLGSGGSMVAKLKLKGIDGRAPPGVEPAA